MSIWTLNRANRSTIFTRFGTRIVNSLFVDSNEYQKQNLSIYVEQCYLNYVR